ncbi:MAG TPA: DUF2252 domain-containing protein [Streptosporangiaceae bacterium]|nr:DUF2252 domain-containing protein [Streptosporangiaceae bacterium]
MPQARTSNQTSTTGRQSARTPAKPAAAKPAGAKPAAQEPAGQAPAAPAQPAARSAARPAAARSARRTAAKPAGRAAPKPLTPGGSSIRAGRLGAEEAEPLTPAQRAALGKAARAAVPRTSHAAFDPPASRPDPVALLEEQAVSRLPDLIPLRYGRMLASAFSYFRGAALPMAADLARTPVTGLTVQACGDAHLSNFGLYASPERKLLFDVNDFDETLPGPWEWDVKRLAASLEVAARDNGFARKDRRQIVLAGVGQYRLMMRQLAGLSNLGVWYTDVNIEEFRREFAAQMTSRQLKTIDKIMVKARGHDSRQALGKLAAVQDGKMRIVADPPLVVPLTDLLPEQMDRAGIETQLRALVGQYRGTLQSDRRVLLEQFDFTDMARKVVGVGSVGTRCWIILLLGRDESDPLFLQVKEAQPSVLARYAGASKYSNQGERVVAGQRLMQAASDIFLGWQRTTGLDGQYRDFYIRQLRDWKFSFPIEAMIPHGLRIYAQICGHALARAHARSGDRIAIASYLGGSDVFDRAVADFAEAYADQNQRDYEALAAAAASGRITAEHGV